MANRTLVVAPHPDDELLGCGGTLLRRKAERGAVGWLIMTSMPDGADWPNERIDRRAIEIAEVARMVGFDAVFELGFPAAHLDTLPLAKLVAAISDVFVKFEPDELFVPHPGDAHSDHFVTFSAAAACAKWFRHPYVRQVLSYETPSETEFGLRGPPFLPNVFVDIEHFIDRKIEILQNYGSELAAFPFPRSGAAVRALATVRGANSGFVAAEAFQLLRQRQSVDLPK